jgi:hypothetical protein
MPALQAIAKYPKTPEHLTTTFGGLVSRITPFAIENRIFQSDIRSSSWFIFALEY